MLFKLLLLQLGFTCSTTADKLRFILSNSRCLRAFNPGFPLFFNLIFFLFLLFYLRMHGNLLTGMKNIHFLSSLKQPTETLRKNTSSRHRENVHVYDK